MVSPLSGFLRILIGLILLAGPVAAGWLHRSPWILLPFAIVFTASYVAGKWNSWRTLGGAGNAGRIVAGLLSTLLVQAIMVGVLYLIGFGAAALFSSNATASRLSAEDLVGVGSLGIFGAVGGLVLSQIEARRLARTLAEAPAEKDAGGGLDAFGRPVSELIVLPDPVTPETFYFGIHYSHGTYSEPGQFDGTPNEQSAGGDAKIAEAEERLGVQLPEGLRALYRVQNGGNVGSLWIAKVPDPRPLYDDWLNPFSGYSDLYPLERLRTVHDAVTDYADPDSPEDAENFPAGCEDMIVLAQWYRETLFLDYRGRQIPRVGFTDFDASTSDDDVRWWESFEDMFRQLRRSE